MFFRLFKKRRAPKAVGDNLSGPSKMDDQANLPTMSDPVPNWETVLTLSLQQNCDAPDPDTIRHAHELFCQHLDAPQKAREHQMTALFTDIQMMLSELKLEFPAFHRMVKDPLPYKRLHHIDGQEG